MLTDREISDLWSWSASADQGVETTQQHAFARAIEREVIERCAAEAEHWQTISTTPGHACGQYIGAAIRAMKEPK